jgi:hypothetical protein
MIRPHLCTVALGGFLLLGTAVQAADTPENQDLQCMIRASSAAATLPPEGKSVASNMVFYYMGRLIGRNPKIDIPARVKETAAQLKGGTARLVAARCDQQLQVVMGRFQRDAAAVNAKP